MWQQILNVCVDMLEMRGYEEIDAISRASLEAATSQPPLPSSALLLAVKGQRNARPGLADETSIFFDLAEKKVGIKAIRSLDDRPDARGHIVVVSESGGTPFVRKGAAQIFSWTQLAQNVTRHTLVPKHTHVWGGDVERLDSESLPLLPTSDPVATFLALLPGQIVKIQRATRGNGCPGVIVHRRVV